MRIAAQLPMNNMGIPGAQSDMLAEWTGKDGHKEPLIKVDTRKPVDLNQLELEENYERK